MKFNFTPNAGRTPLEQLQLTAKTSELYDEELLSSLANSEQQLSYLQMIASTNSLALKDRLGANFNKISDSTLKYRKLENEYQIAVLEKAISDGTYSSGYAQALNDKFSKDERISGNNAVSTIVKHRYDGDYSKFMSEYKDADTTMNDEYLAFAEVYDADETRETLDYMKQSAESLSKEEDALYNLYQQRDLLDQYIAQDRITQAKRLAYENASFWEKSGAALIQILSAPITEGGNVIEGLIDAVALSFGQTEFVSQDIIDLDARLAVSLPNSYITSPYADENPLKWLYEIETSIIDMAPMALNLVAPYVGTAVYYISAAGRAAEGFMQEAPDIGWGGVVTYTAAVTIIEMLTEKINTDAVFGKGFFTKLEDMIPGKGNVAAELAKQALGEGLEEVVSEIGSQTVATLMTGDNKYDVHQVLRAGALGAATGAVIQTASTTLLTKRALGIGTKISLDTNDYIVLNARESAIVEDFMERTQKRIDAGKKLSKRDQRIYDDFSKLSFSDTIINENGPKHGIWTGEVTRRMGQTVDAKYAYAKEGVIEHDIQWLKKQKTLGAKGYYIPGNAATRFTGATPADVDVQSDVLADTLGRGRSDAIYNALLDAVRTTGSLEIAKQQFTKEELETVIPTDTLETAQKVYSRAASMWFTALLKDAPTDINQQSNMAAVNEYYYGSLETILTKCKFKLVKSEKASRALKNVLNLNDAEVVNLSGDSEIKSFLSKVTKFYGSDNSIYKLNKIYTYITNNPNTPIVAIVGNDLYINAKFLTTLGQQSILRAIEMESITAKVNTTIATDEKTLSVLDDAVNAIDTAPIDLSADITDMSRRRDYLRRRVIYTALFAPGNDIAIQLSQSNHKLYENIRDILVERTKSANIEIRNTAYRGLYVYDSTILRRVSEDEATSKNLLSGNYSIEDLQSGNGPDVNREFLRYGEDMSKGAIKVLSAVNHLTTEFGLETSTESFYQVLSDIQNESKYKNIDRLTAVLKRYAGEPFKQAINHYLNDQFNFEIGATGNIISTAAIADMLDMTKLENVIAEAQDKISIVELSDLLSERGKAELQTDATVAFIPENLRDEYLARDVATGEANLASTGKSLLTVTVSDDTPDVHEIQHYLSHSAKFVNGAAAFLSPKTILDIRASMSPNDQAEFDAALKEFVLNNSGGLLLAVAKQAVADNDISWLVSNACDIIYFKFDVDEDYSNFKSTRNLFHTYNTTVTDNLGIPKVHVAFEIHPDATLSAADRGFLEFFTGKSFVYSASDSKINETLARLEAKTTTMDDIVEAVDDAEFVIEPSESRGSDYLTKLRTGLFDFTGKEPTDADLCNPQYLASVCVKPDIKQRLLNNTPEQCKALIGRLTGLTFNDYTGTFVEPGKPIPFGDYVKYIDKESIVIQKPNQTVVQLPRDFTTGKYSKLNAILADLDADNTTFYVDDKIFVSKASALEYLDSSKVAVTKTLKDTKVTRGFDTLIDSIIPNGFRHTSDFVFVTNDGKVFSHDTAGNFAGFFETLCSNFKLDPRIMTNGMEIGQDGKPTGLLEDGIAKRLFDAKKIVRAYFINGQWQAYGKPNYLQDNLLRQLNVEPEARPYVVPGDSAYSEIIPGTTRLVVNDKGTVGIDRTGKSVYPEVSWKDGTWYPTICQIIEKYDIKKMSELKDLGFNQEFIEVLATNYGRSIQGKTAGKLGISAETMRKSKEYAGVQQAAITKFMNDDSASEFARNLLIQNSFERVSTDNLDWSKAAHIRSVSDANAYLKAIVSWSGTLQRLNNHKKYNSLEELVLDCKREYIQGDEENSLLANIIAQGKTEVYFDNVVSEFLNIDARQAAKHGSVFVTENLDYSLDGFNVAVNLIRRGYTQRTTSVKAGSIEINTAGRHVDDAESVDVSDTAGSTLDKSKSVQGDTVLEAAEDSVVLKNYQTNLKRAMEFTGAKRLTAFNKILDWLNDRNQKSIKAIDEPDQFVLKLIADIKSKIAKETQVADTNNQAVTKIITDATKRIEKSEDKRAQHQSEYNTVTQLDNKRRIIAQYGEEGYRRILDALSTEAIFGDTKALSNIKDNISKRLRDTGSASIKARIDKLYFGPTAEKLNSLANVLGSLRANFNGIKPGTVLATDMKFKYSELLTKYYNFLGKFAQTNNAAGFAEIKAEYNEVAKYLDNLILTGDFNFEKVYPEHGVWAVNAEKLINGSFESDSEFAPLNALSQSDRVTMLSNWIMTANQNNWPEAVVDRMRAVLENAELEAGPSQTRRPDKITKPKVDMSILNDVTQTAGLSSDAIAAMNAIADTINNKAKQHSADAAEKKRIAEHVREANKAIQDATYLTRSYNRLSRKEKQYLDSPAITIQQAQQLVAYASEVITGFDYQSRINAFLERARNAWKNDKSAHVAKVKAILKEKAEYPDYVVEEAKRSKMLYIRNRAEAYEEAAAIERYKYLSKLAEGRENATQTDSTVEPTKNGSNIIPTLTTNNFDDLLTAFAVAEPRETVAPQAFDKYYTEHKSLQKILDDAREQEEHEKLNSIINGVAQALREFEYRPLTLASATKFMADIKSVLSDGVINESFFGWKPVSIQRKKREIAHSAEENSAETLERLLDKLKAGEFTSRYEITKNAQDKFSKEVTAAISNIIEDVKVATLTEEDFNLDSDLQRRTRNHEDDEIEFELEENIEDLTFDDEEFEIEPSAKFSDKLDDFTIEEDFTVEDDFTLDNVTDSKSEKSTKKDTKKKPERPIEEQFPGFSDDDARSSWKTVKSDLLIRAGVDIQTALNYEFSRTRTVNVMGESQERYNIDTNEFITNPVIADIMLQLKSNPQAISDFLDWCAEARATSPEVQMKALIILNKLAAIPTIDSKLLKRIEITRSNIKSIGGTILGLGNRHGLNPIEEICFIAKTEINLADDDIKLLTKLSNKQDIAIKQRNFTESDKLMKEALKVFEKYSDQLDDSINPFKDIESYPRLKEARKKLNSAKTPEQRSAARAEFEQARIDVQNERAVRWQNLTNKITSWRYFAMLSAPVTFWAKNEAGNAVARGLNAASTALSTQVIKLVEKRRPNKYRRTNMAISTEVNTAVDKQLVENGLVNSILNNEAAKYDSGFKYRPNAVANAATSVAKGEQVNIASIGQLLNQEKLVKGDNIVAEGINKFYRLIFNTMDAADRKYVAKSIIRMTKRLVADNMTTSEIAELASGKVSDATRAKFDDMVDYAREESLKVYFRSTPEVYTTLMGMFKDHPLAQAVFSVICPFPRMVINTTMTTIAYSPLGFIQAALTLAKDTSMYANITASQQLSKACVGTVAMLVGAILAAIGWIDIDDEDKYAGPQLVIFDKLRISLEGLEPSATPVIVGSMLVLGPKTDGEANAFSAAANALLNTTVLGEIMSQFGQGKTATEWVGTTFTSFVTQFIPTILKRTAQLVDPGKKNYSGNFSTLKRIAAAIPGLSFLVENKVDPYTGEDLVQHTDNNNPYLSRLLVLLNATVFATKVSWAEDSELETESKAVGAATTGPARTITIDGQEYRLTEKQYEEYAKLRAKLYSQYASDLIKTDAYKNMSIEKRKAKLKQLQSKATKAARKELNIP